jgi:voltage-gated potassium channel
VGYSLRLPVSAVIIARFIFIFSESTNYTFSGSVKTTAMYRKTKKMVYQLLHPNEGATRWDKIINSFLVILIILNVIAVMLETVPAIHEPRKQLFRDFDIFSVAIFSVEYLLRLWSANYHEKYKHSIGGRLKYIFSPAALVDLVAILPFYLGLDLRVLRIFRLTRILRIFRLTSYTKSTQLIINVFKSRFKELLLSFILTVFLIIISSCLMYFAEHGAQPEKFSSIPATIWWSVITLTTVGYGDMVPHTEIGKILTIIISLSGIALLALPAGIITAGFLDELRKIKKPGVCPHCGKPLEEVDK